METKRKPTNKRFKTHKPISLIIEENPNWDFVNSKKNYVPPLLPKGHIKFRESGEFIWESKKSYLANGRKIHPVVAIVKAMNGWNFQYYGKRRISIRNFSTLEQALSWTNKWLKKNDL